MSAAKNPVIRLALKLPPIRRVRDRIVFLRSALAENQAALTAVRAFATAKQRELEQARADLADTKDGLQSQLGSARTHAAHVEERAEQAESRAASALAAANIAAARILELEEETKSKGQYIQDQNTAYCILADKAVATERRAYILQSDFNRCAERCDALRERVALQDHAAAEDAETIQDLKNALADGKAQGASLEGQLKHLANQLGDANTDHSVAERSWRGQIAHLSNQVTDARTDGRAAVAALGTLAPRLAEAQARNAQLVSIINRTTAEPSAAKAAKVPASINRLGPVYDCFTFFNELDLLEIRLTELDPVVDVFVIAECPITFQGNSKPLFFAENRQRFARFADKIHHIVVDDMPDTIDTWTREHHQRNALRRGLADAPANAFAMIGDLDELPSRRAVIEAQRRGGFVFFCLDLFYYYLNWMKAERGKGPWTASYMAPLATITALDSFSRPRMEGRKFLSEIGVEDSTAFVDEGGWHFSWVGGIDNMLKKLTAFSHVEPEISAFSEGDALKRAVGDMKLFFSGEPLQAVSPLVNFPELVMLDPDAYVIKGLLTPDYASLPVYYRAARPVLVAAGAVAEQD